MAGKRKVFIDTDVTLDHLADRQPFAEYAHRLFALAETGQLDLFLSALSFSNLYYILRKLKGHAEAIALLRQLKRLIKVTAVTDLEIQNALDSSFKDFEDAIQHFSAQSEADVTIILTRNKADYGASTLPILTPAEFFLLHDPGQD
jgi:predicted nucleic acid-binding protein